MESGMSEAMGMEEDGRRSGLALSISHHSITPQDDTTPHHTTSRHTDNMKQEKEKKKKFREAYIVGSAIDKF
jgi:hypothetical protein